METIKFHHVVVLLSLILSLLGTLLILEKINAAAEPIPTATATVKVTIPAQENVELQQVEVRVTPIEEG